MDKGRAGEDYILGGQNLTFPELWAAVADVLGKRPPTRRIPLGFLRAAATASRLLTGKSALPPEFFEMISYNWCFNSQKAREALGWQALPFRTAIAETWAEYQAGGWKPSV
jgi:nucleoside-diphosphate-sugar epimerase